MVDSKRIRYLKDLPYQGGPVVYVMGRDFRVDDNWALLYAQELAISYKQPLCVLVHFGKNILETNARQHSFLVEGLEEVAQELESLNIPFFITFGDWRTEVRTFITKHQIGQIVTDFSPLHELRWWWDEVVAGFELPIHEVDAHNIVPVWIASQKEEFAAHTLRPKIHKLYRDFSGPVPEVVSHPYTWIPSASVCWPRSLDHTGCEVINWSGIKKMRSFTIDVQPVRWCKAGPKAAVAMLNRFLDSKIAEYAERRNDPNAEVLSNLSPYLRHGFISAQRVALEVERHKGDRTSKEAFLEELVVRRELAENYCFYNTNYDSFLGLRDWAKKSLDEHRSDVREFLYTLEEFEAARTHDPLWNAAQTEMKETGKMHGYLRMYWAKKILEWTKSPEEAIEIAVLLNDRYSIDGRDPNGYVGVLWSIGGIHDRAWFERDIFGKIRYMNYNGAKKKFDVKAYIARHLNKQAAFL